MMENIYPCLKPVSVFLQNEKDFATLHHIGANFLKKHSIAVLFETLTF